MPLDGTFSSTRQQPSAVQQKCQFNSRDNWQLGTAWHQDTAQLGIELALIHVHRYWQMMFILHCMWMWMGMMEVIEYLWHVLCREAKSEFQYLSFSMIDFRL